MIGLKETEDLSVLCLWLDPLFRSSALRNARRLNGKQPSTPDDHRLNEGEAAIHLTWLRGPDNT